jgi:regulator of protease activity HflC (stomatin/prohibitin superfamily)
VILAAEGRKESAFRDAEARERQAEAEARATEAVSKAISEGNVQAINYFVAQKYIDALSDFAKGPNQKVMFMPLDASGVMAAIGGISEIARGAFGGDKSGGTGSGG